MTASGQTSPTAGAVYALHGRSIQPERVRVVMGWIVNTRAVSLEVESAGYNEECAGVNLAGVTSSCRRARAGPAPRLTRESNPTIRPGTLPP